MIIYLGRYMHDGIFKGTNFFLVWLIIQQVKYKFTNRIIATDLLSKYKFIL